MDQSRPTPSTVWVVQREYDHEEPKFEVLGVFTSKKLADMRAFYEKNRPEPDDDDCDCDSYHGDDQIVTVREMTLDAV